MPSGTTINKLLSANINHRRSQTEGSVSENIDTVKLNNQMIPQTRIQFNLNIINKNEAMKVKSPFLEANNNKKVSMRTKDMKGKHTKVKSGNMLNLNKNYYLNHIKANCDNLSSIRLTKMFKIQNKYDQKPRQRYFEQEQNNLEGKQQKINKSIGPKENIEKSQFISSRNGPNYKLNKREQIKSSNLKSSSGFQHKTNNSVDEISKIFSRNASKSLRNRQKLNNFQNQIKMSQFQMKHDQNKSGTFQKSVRMSKIQTMIKRQTIQKQKMSFELSLEVGTWKKEITTICQCLHELLDYGNSEKKLSKVIQRYFANKKKGYLDIFMKKAENKKSLTNQICYQACKLPDKIMKNIINKLLQGSSQNQKDTYFMGLQVTQYRNFLEQKISNQNCNQLFQIQQKVKNNVQSCVRMKQFAKQMFSTSQQNNQIFSFFTDLGKIEDDYGKLNLVSVKNRNRFQNIADSQAIIKQYIDY